MNDASAPDAPEFDAIVVGAGFTGTAMVGKQHEFGFFVRAYERGADGGGTWYRNRYRGARCDAPSVQYACPFSDELQQHWRWSEVFAAQPENPSYAQHVVDRCGRRRLFAFNTAVTSAVA